MFIKPGMEKVVTEIFDMVTTEGRWVKSGVHRMTIAGIDFDAHFYEDRNHMGDVMSTYHRLEADGWFVQWYGSGNRMNRSGDGDKLSRDLTMCMLSGELENNLDA